MLTTLTLIETLVGLKKGSFTSTDLVNAYFDKIERSNPVLNAYIKTLKQEALESAGLADAKVSSEGADVYERQPLLGVPYACKDNFCTLGVETTAASNILKGFIPPYESTVTAKLKKAGAILIGKTNMDAFAHGSSTEESDFGSSLNPWNTSKVPGGSSGGSAIAVAADLCVFATGSETAGSIRGPASWCGVTGLKPTYGRVSRYGVIAMASSTDSPGVLTKDVKDAAFLLNVLAGKDPYDATTSPVTPDNYLKSVDTESDVSEDLQGVTIGVPVEYMDAIQDKFYRARIEEALSVFAKLGAKIKEISLLDPKYSIAIYTILQRSEVSSNLGRFSGVRYGEKREEFNFENKKRILLGTYALSSGYYDQYYAKAQKARTLLVEDFKNAFKEVDLIFGPTMPGVALSVGESKNYSMFGELIDLLQEPSSIAGLPAISLPAGMQEGLPVGVQIIANYFEENLMLRVSSAFQKKTEFHKFKPSAQSYEHI